MNESTLVPREEMNDLDWLARNVHVWPAGDHQPWCYVYMAHGGVMKASGNFLDAVAKPTMITIDQWLARRAESGVAALHGFHGHPGGVAHGDGGGAGRRRGAVVQAAQPAQRGEPPRLITAARHLERIDVERGERGALVEDGALDRFGQIACGS